jgi:hypothetical protein
MPQDTKPTETSLSAKLAKEFGRDPKKTTILAVLLIVGVVFGLRTINKQSPSSAEAGGLGDMAIFSGESASAGPVVPFRDFASSEEPKDLNLASMNLEVTRDLFSFDASHFERIVKDDPVVDRPDETPDMQGPEVGESERIAAIHQLATELDLQSTMASDRPAAMINGKVLGVGDRINGFRIVQISTGQCVVEQDGVRISLQMTQEQ